MTADNDSPEDRARVRAKIAPLIIAYAKMIGEAPFYAHDLFAFVRYTSGLLVAPASPDRILRDLRQRGIINYGVDRSNSLYWFLPVGDRNWMLGD